MKQITLLLLSIIFICSCKQSPVKNQVAAKPDIPKPLQDDSKDFSLISKSRGEDLMHAIYDDLVKKSPELQKLEDQKIHFQEGRADSVKAFNNYDSKSGNYYSDAIGALSQVKDSILKQRLRLLLTNSQKKYAIKTSKFALLLKSIDDDELSRADYDMTLKVAATLSVVEDYQDKSLPDIKSVKAIAEESRKLNQQTKKLAEKYESEADVKK